jgi:O-methyltransferase involved in polyketide biosynthesis
MAAFDREIRRFLAASPGATVVALGEGLETQFWRVDDGAVRWVTVDLPESVALRDALLPREPRMTTIAGSALDLAWTDAVDAGRPVLVTAQGLLMYLERADVHGLLAACAERFPGQATLFDTVPRWTSRREMPATPSGYRPPAWRWSVDRAELEALRALPGIAALDLVRLPRGRGAALGLLLPLATRIPALRLALPAVLRARFRGARTAA